MSRYPLLIDFSSRLDWIVHFRHEQESSLPDRLISCAAGALQDRLIHERSVRNSMVTHWLYDPAAREGSDLVIVDAIEGTKTFRWVDFPNRPWGEAPPVCVCQEPISSRGRPRRWVMDPLEFNELSKTSEVTMVCSWCERTVVVRPKTNRVPEIQQISSFLYMEI